MTVLYLFDRVDTRQVTFAKINISNNGFWLVLLGGVYKFICLTKIYRTKAKKLKLINDAVSVLTIV